MFCVCIRYHYHYVLCVIVTVHVVFLVIQYVHSLEGGGKSACPQSLGRPLQVRSPSRSFCGVVKHFFSNVEYQKILAIKFQKLNHHMF